MTSRALSHGEVKALFRQLVTAAGGVDASGITLGVSHQRVSTLQNVNHDDMPTFAQIMALEVVAGCPIVTGAAARAVGGERPADLADAAVEAVAAHAHALTLVHTMDADGKRDVSEIRTVQAAARQGLEKAQRLVDATCSLSAVAS